MRSAILTLALVLLAAAPAAAQQDLRSPDARDAAAGRSTLDAPPLINQDLRSPDARDAAADRSTLDAPQVTVVKVPQPAPIPAGGIDWADAGMGAAIVLLLSAAGVIAVVSAGARTRRPRSPRDRRGLVDEACQGAGGLDAQLAGRRRTVTGLTVQ